MVILTLLLGYIDISNSKMRNVQFVYFTQRSFGIKESKKNEKFFNLRNFFLVLDSISVLLLNSW